MCCLHDSDLRFFLSAPRTFSFTNLFTKIFLHPPGMYEIKQTTMAGPFTKEKNKRPKTEETNCTIINRDDTGVQGLSPKET